MAFLGIDFGTTNCSVSKYELGKTSVLPIKGKMTTPSVLYIEGSSVEVGHDAKMYIAVHPDKCLASTKRDMGTTTVYNIGGKEITPVLAASLILKYLKEETEAYLNDVCNDVVITVPASFGSEERNATKQAAINAGWNPIALLDEPTAAAINYVQNRNKSSLFTVVDLGGGAFGVTVLQYLNENGKAKFKPLKVGGNHRLGGDDFDKAIVRYMIDEGASGYKSELELKEEAEKAKIALSTIDVAGISCEYVDTTLTRDKYKELIASYLDEICDTIKKTVSGAGKSFDDIDRFILVGGSCKHPVVKEAVKDCVGRTPYAVDNLNTAVSEGAALYHYLLGRCCSEGCDELDNNLDNKLQNNVLCLKYKEYVKFLEDLQKSTIDENYCVFEQNNQVVIDWGKVFTCLDKLYINNGYVLDDYRSLSSDNNILSLYARVSNVNRPDEEDWVRWEYNHIPHASFRHLTCGFIMDDNDERREFFRIPYTHDNMTEEQKCILKERIEMPPKIDPLQVITLERTPDAIWQAFLPHITYMFTGYRWHGGYVHKELVFSKKDVLAIKPELLPILTIDDKTFIPEIVFDADNP